MCTYNLPIFVVGVTVLSSNHECISTWSNLDKNPVEAVDISRTRSVRDRPQEEVATSDSVCHNDCCC